jgi:glycerol-3-phosphate acyltransferase PlsY
MITAAVSLAAYLAGSVNFSIVLFRILGWEDPREAFSGNPGVTNVYRIKGPVLAGIILVLDLGRSFLVAWAATHFLPLHLVPAAGLALMIGNRYPCFHGFRGGKGVSTFIGFTLYANPLFAAASMALWVLIYGIVRIPFIASFGMALVLMAGLFLYVKMDPVGVLLAFHMLVLVVISHRGNIHALVNSRREEA